MNELNFRDYINRKYGSCFRTKQSTNENTFQDMVRNNFIQAYEDAGQQPQFMVSISYFVKEMSLERVKKNNKRINDVLEDMFNPRNTVAYRVSKDHFIERRDPKLKTTSAVRVKNTITGKYEYDFNAEIFEGSFDTHHLIGPIRDSVIDKPNGNIRNALEEIYPYENIPRDSFGDPEYIIIKKALIDYAIRQRCYKFVGNSDQSLKSIETNCQKHYDGFSDYRGLVAYVTKKIRSAEDLLIGYDSDNSDSFPTS
jgi:hypothetical protein